ncbi:MAG TPA: helix-turn-helix domain-containing protein [bacterium]
MENIGQILKNKRTELKKSFEEIHAQTRITVAHLQLLEENNFTFLPETYIKSFIKTYASALDLNSAEVLRKFNFNKEEKKAEEEKESKIRAAQDQASLPINRILEWALAAGAFLLLVFIVLVYLQYRSEIYARPLEHNNGHMNRLEFEDGAAAMFSSAPLSLTTKSFQLQIVGLEQVAIQLEVTGFHDAAAHGAPTRPSIVTAVERFDIVIDEANGMKLKFDDMEMADLRNSGGKMKLSIIRGSSR